MKAEPMSRALWSGPALGGKATKKFLAPEQSDLQQQTAVWNVDRADFSNAAAA